MGLYLTRRLDGISSKRAFLEIESDLFVKEVRGSKMLKWGVLH